MPRSLAQEHSHNRAGRDLYNSPGHSLSLPGFELTKTQILNPQAKGPLGRDGGEKNKFGHKDIETDEIMHPRRER